MGINFPASPSAGQKFMSGGTSYTFTNGAWRPAVGMALPRNYLINPAMSVSLQLGTTATAITGNGYALDQWKMGGSGAPTFTTQQLALTTPFGSPFRLRATLTALGTGTGRSALLLQSLEGNRISDLRFGSASAKQVMARIGVRSSVAATYDFFVRNIAANQIYPAPLTIGAGQINTDLYFSFAIPGSTQGAWPTDNTLGMEFGFNVTAGALAIGGTPNAWGPSLFASLGTPTVSTVIDLFDCGLYADPNLTSRAPPWEHPNIRQVVTDSQRYWAKLMVGRGVATSATAANRLGGPYMTTMRATPALAEAGAITLYDGTVNNALATVGTTYLTDGSCEFNATGTGLTVARPVAMVNNNQANYIACSARL